MDTQIYQPKPRPEKIRRDDNLIDAICILQVAFDKVPPDSAKQWQARATLLSAIAKLSRQVTTIKIEYL